MSVMVLQAFKKYEILTRKREAEIMRNEETKKVERMSQAPKTNVEDELPIVVPNETEGDQEREGKGAGEASVSPTKEVVERKEKKSPKKDSSEHQLKKERTKAFNYTSDTFNGGDVGAYKWSQTVTEVEIKVSLHEGATGKHIRVDISNDHLKVEVLKPERKVELCTAVYVCGQCIFL